MGLIEEIPKLVRSDYEREREQGNSKPLLNVHIGCILPSLIFKLYKMICQNIYCILIKHE